MPLFLAPPRRLPGPRTGRTPSLRFCITAPMPYGSRTTFLLDSYSHTILLHGFVSLMHFQHTAHALRSRHAVYVPALTTVCDAHLVTSRLLVCWFLTGRIRTHHCTCTIFTVSAPLLLWFTFLPAAHTARTKFLVHLVPGHSHWDTHRRTTTGSWTVFHGRFISHTCLPRTVHTTPHYSRF